MIGSARSLLARSSRALLVSQTSNTSGNLARHIGRIMSGVDLSEVKHDPSKRQFSCSITKDGQECQEKAVVDYNWLDDNTLDFYHTEVPEVFRGRGIAKVLAKTALDYVVSQDKKMRLTCTYLQKYVKDNPQAGYDSRVVPLN